MKNTKGKYPLQWSADGPQTVRSVGIFTVQTVRRPSANHYIHQFFLSANGLRTV